MNCFEICDISTHNCHGKSYVTNDVFSENEVFILHVKSGKGKAVYKGESTSLSAGDFLVICGKDALSYQFSPSQNSVFLRVLLKVSDKAQFEEIFSLPGGVYHCFEPVCAEGLFSDAMLEFLIGTSPSQAKSNALLTEFLCALSSARTPLCDAERECALLFKEISENFISEIDVTAYAKRAGLSRDRLSVIFKKRYGMAPYKYQLSLKMKEATFLLSHTDLPVGEISRMMGFSAPHYFSSAYKKQTGLSPLEVRKPESF